jgi:hypothetical protein
MVSGFWFQVQRNPDQLQFTNGEPAASNSLHSSTDSMYMSLNQSLKAIDLAIQNPEATFSYK